MTAVTQGGSILLAELLQLDYKICVLIVCILSTVFIFHSGSQGVLMVNTIKFIIIMIIAAIAGIYVMSLSGGWTEAIGSLAVFENKPGIMSWHGMVTGPKALWTTPLSSVSWAVGMGITWAVVISVGPWESSLYLMAKNEHVTLRAALLVPAFLLSFYVLLQFSAAGINLINPDIQPSERAYIWAAFNIMPAWMGVLLLGGIMTVALSACATFLNLVGLSVTRDIMGKENPDARTLMLSRMVMLGVGVVVLITCMFQPPAVMWIGYFAASIFGASWGPVAFMSVWWKRVTADGAFWGILSGAVVVIGAQAMTKFGGVEFPLIFQPPILGILASTSVAWFISTKGVPSADEKTFYNTLHNPPVEVDDPILYAGTVKLAKVVLGVGILMMLLLFYFYSMPYTTAVGGM